MSDTANLFLLAGIWSLIAIVIVRLIPVPWPARIAVLALLVGVPFWELPYGYYNFKDLCREHGGLRNFEKFGPQTSVCASYPIDSAAGSLLSNGLVIVEAQDEDGRIKTITKETIDRAVKAERIPISSAYCVRHAFVQGLPWRIQRNEYLITGATDQRIAARFSDYVWYGTWWQQQMLPLLGRGGECRHGDPLKAVASALLTGVK